MRRNELKFHHILHLFNSSRPDTAQGYMCIFTQPSYLIATHGHYNQRVNASAQMPLCMSGMCMCVSECSVCMSGRMRFKKREPAALTVGRNMDEMSDGANAE